MPTVRPKRFVPFREEGYVSSLSKEQRDALEGARRTMEDWVDDKVDELVEKMQQPIQEAADQLNAEVEKISAELQTTRERLGTIEQRLAELKADIDLGDGKNLEQAIQETQALTNRLHDELESREAKWKALGSGIVNTGVAAAQKLILPL